MLKRLPESKNMILVSSLISSDSETLCFMFRVISSHMRRGKGEGRKVRGQLCRQAKRRGPYRNMYSVDEIKQRQKVIILIV